MSAPETQAHPSPHRPIEPPLAPGRPLRWLPDTQAIWFGHIAIVLLGLTYWNFRANSAITRLFGTDRDPMMRDVHQLFAYGVPVMLAMLAMLHGFSWWAARKGLIASKRDGLAQIGRTLWPALFTVPVLLIACFLWIFHEVRWLTWAPFQGLAIGMMVWQFYLWRQPLLPPHEPLQPGPGAPRPAYIYWVLGALAAVVCIYTAWFGYLVSWRHWSIGTALHDFGIYDQLMYNTMQGRWFEAGMFNSERIGYNLREFDNHFFAEHFIPTFWIVTPFYWLFPDAVTVLLAQTVLLALGAVPVYLIALNKLRSPLVGLAFAMLFLVHPLIQQTNIKDVHIDSFAPVFLLASFAAYLYKRWILYGVFLLLALGVKEEISVNVAAMGLFILLGERDWKAGLATFAAGVAWFVLVIGVVMPWYRDGLPVRQIDRYAHLIPPDQRDPDGVLTKGMVLKAMITNPLHVLELLSSQLRIRGAFILISPFALFALWGRWAWIWILPLLAAALLSGLFMQFEMIHHYGVTIVPAALVASIYGAWWLLRRDLEPEAPLPLARVAGLTAVLGFMILITSYEFGFQPGGKRYQAEDYTVYPHNELGFRYLEAIPDDDDVIVSAQLELGGQLTHRRYIYTYPEVADAEYILLDTRGFYWPFSEEAEFRRHVVELLESDEWGLMLPYEDGYLLFKKGHPTDLNEATIPRLVFERYRPARYGGS